MTKIEFINKVLETPDDVFENLFNDIDLKEMINIYIKVDGDLTPFKFIDINKQGIYFELKEDVRIKDIKITDYKNWFQINWKIKED